MTARALIIRDGNLLLMHRYKYGKEYFVLPGGHLEAGETPEEAVIREVYEETGLVVTHTKLLWKLYNTFDNAEHVYFEVQVGAGDPVLGGPEIDRHCEENSYALEWHALTKLSALPIIPEELQQHIHSIYLTT